MLRHLLFVPPFGPLADPRLLADLAAEAETHGWDGFFLFDHVLRPRDETTDVLDPWVVLSAIATTTTRIRIGPLVTPATRRRPIKLAREIVTLDLLSQGRLTVGFGLGVDTDGELTRLGELTDAAVRGQRLDESVSLIDSWLTRGHANHRGAHFVAVDVTFGPCPAQDPRPPFWFAVRGEHTRPARRAARYEGVFPIEVDLDQLKRLLDVVGNERGTLDDYDVVVSNHPSNGTPGSEEQLLAAGVTWLAHRVAPNSTPNQVRAEITKLGR